MGRWVEKKAADGECEGEKGGKPCSVLFIPLNPQCFRSDPPRTERVDFIHIVSRMIRT
jgi:hypothetical protein